MSDRLVAISAAGGIFPEASNVRALWEFIAAGRSAAREPSHGRWTIPLEEAYFPGPPAPDKVYSRRACFVDSVPNFDRSTPFPLEPLDGMVKLALAAAAATLDGFPIDHWRPERVGVCIGNIALPTVGSSRWSRRVLLPRIAAQLGIPTPNLPDAHPLDRFVTGLPAGMIARAFGFRGAVRTVDAACASSLYAIKSAVDDLLDGRADAMLAGGMARPDPLYTQMGFCQLHALSPSGTCRPFDAAADGLVVGEGACFFVLERLADAVRLKRNILGVVHGVGLSNDVEGNLLAPDSEGQLRAMRAAYATAGWSPTDVDLIECHATGTPTGDRVELASLHSLWNDSSPRGPCVIGSVKSNVGHLLTGAGAAGLAKALGSFARRELLPTANFERMNSDRDPRSPFEVLRQPRDWRTPSGGGPRRAAVSAFGFGGINAHLLVEEWREQTVGTSVPSLGTPEKPTSVSIVGVGVRVGPWQGKEAFVRRALFGEGLELADCDLGCREFDVPLGRFAIPPKEFADMLPQQTLMLQAVDEAWREVGGDALTSERRKRVGGYFGIGLDLETTNFDLRWSAREFAAPAELDSMRDRISPPLTADRTLGALGGVVASRIARVYKLGGPNYTLSCEEASGLAALDAAVLALGRGEIDLAVVGAVDLPTDPRVVESDRLLSKTDRTPLADGAAAFILKRTVDADRDGDFQYAALRGVTGGIGPAQRDSLAREESAPLWLQPESLVGRTGAASGLVALVQASLALAGRIRPPSSVGEPAIPWLRNREVGARTAIVSATSVDGSAWSATVEQPNAGKPIPEWLALPDGSDERVFTFTAVDRSSLVNRLRDAVAREEGPPARPSAESTSSRLAIVARPQELRDRLLRTIESLETERPVGDDVFFCESFEVPKELAFVYPGSGAQFVGMGRDWALAFPNVVERMDQGNRRLRDQFAADVFWVNNSGRLDDPLGVIQGQVSVGLLLTAILAEFGVKPRATLGYSLGESAALFAVGAWSDRDEMLRRLEDSGLFKSDLAGRCDAARKTWNLDDDESVDWLTAVVNRPAADVRQAVEGVDRAYLLFVNTPRQCVLGGDRGAVLEVLTQLNAPHVEVRGASTVHSPVAEAVGEEYFRLHQMPTKPPNGVRCYSAASGNAFVPNDESAAEAITALATGTVDFPRVVEQAYRDGVRVFLEVGPGSSCSRMIAAILGDRPHRCISLCVEGAAPHAVLRRALAALWAEGFAIDFAALNPPSRGNSIPAEKTMHVEYRRPVFFDESPAPPIANLEFRSVLRSTPEEKSVNVAAAARTVPTAAPLAKSSVSNAVVAQWSATQEAVASAHSSFLSYQKATSDQWLRLLERVHGRSSAPANGPPEPDVPSSPPDETPGEPPRSLDREQCLAFAVGTIGSVLGGKYAEIDSFPTRVRLPDQPLMLVDRVLDVEGDPLSMQPGRVVTEHDVLPDAWYLDGGRIPTCIAVESGQADLFLSGYLGIDFETRGLAMYRLLDAVVAFHAPLPRPGRTIRYDIRIERFFEHAGSQFFHFNFDATVDGELLLTMRQGCAGFFSPEALAAGRGVVRTALDAKARPGTTPADWRPLVELGPGSMSDAEVEALRRGDLARAFGDEFSNLAIVKPATIPGGRMRLVHRVPSVDPNGGRYGLGVIRGEADVHPDDWFLVCHFIDDRVMPGTLMYECCLHTLRILLARMGWLAEEGDVAFEPVAGVSSRLKCRGQVIESTGKAWYEVEIKEIGFNPAPYVIADALMYADGKPIVEMTDMSLQLSGQTRESLEAVWSERRHAAGTKAPLYDKQSILEFAVGRPSLAFGDRYRAFDSERVIARLPGPPYQFLDRVVEVVGEPWLMKPGAACTAEYDVPPHEWYFDANSGGPMPFAVLLEIALQPCGWLAAYVGSALASEIDLSFRNLGGKATQHAVVGRSTGTLTTRVKMTAASSSGGMVIQHFDFDVRAGGKPIYAGETYFGFFTREALANQVGVRDVFPYRPTDAELRRAKSYPFPRTPPHPGDHLRMMDDVAVHVADGGPHGLGFIQGRKIVRPDEWFFKAHFHQDPVWPGSLGLEAMLQLMGTMATERWGRPGSFQSAALGVEHRWTYRGQVLPTASEVVVQATTKAIDDERRIITADGLLGVDGRTIYQMFDFTVGWNHA
jgi:acyl transferase domain-containing protein/3-hydroxymyristoyl/3-hydroxydecanoyl-(acyl carrier protein) dehydratase